MMNRIEVPIAQFSFTQKLDLMEALWADMAGNEKKLASPAWHEAILNDREAGKKLKKESIKTSHEDKNPQRC
jgi:hypothetical protein